MKVADRFEPLHKLKEESFQLRAGMGPEAIAWMTFLAVLVAPLFEEYILQWLPD